MTRRPRASQGLVPHLAAGPSTGQPGGVGLSIDGKPGIFEKS
jgi:hypothetical protein